jgi:DNA-directed RNA polymerase specialized sigma24 family protein
MKMIQIGRNSHTCIVQRLHVVLEELPPEKRAAVLLRFWENWDIAEISRVLGRSWTSTDHLIESTLRELRSKLGSESRAA